MITAAGLPGIQHLTAREGGIWAIHDNDGAHTADEAAERDPHLLLDPENAKVIGHAAADVLAELDPSAEALYRANAVALATRLEALTQTLRSQLAPLREVPYLVFHDAYQYFEHRFGLQSAGSIVVQPGQAPGARRLLELRQTIRARNVRCVFEEPQFEPRLVRVIVEGTGARAGTLDPLGAALPAGPGQYEALLHALADSLVACLGS